MHHACSIFSPPLILFVRKSRIFTKHVKRTENASRERSFVSGLLLPLVFFGGGNILWSFVYKIWRSPCFLFCLSSFVCSEFCILKRKAFKINGIWRRWQRGRWNCDWRNNSLLFICNLQKFFNCPFGFIDNNNDLDLPSSQLRWILSFNLHGYFIHALKN